MNPPTPDRPAPQRQVVRGSAARVASALAALLGLGSAAVSGYWALGGDGLLDTVGGEIEEWGRRGGPSVVVALWLVVVVKTVVALAAPILVTSQWLTRPGPRSS